MDPQFAQDLKNAGVTVEQYRKMTMREAIDLTLPKRDWHEGRMGDTDIPSHSEMPDVTIGFHDNLPVQPAEDEDEEATIARAEREKAANDSVIRDLTRRLGVPVHFGAAYSFSVSPGSDSISDMKPIAATKEAVAVG